jgi:hypothetical protein
MSPSSQYARKPRKAAEIFTRGDKSTQFVVNIVYNNYEERSQTLNVVKLASAGMKAPFLPRLTLCSLLRLKVLVFLYNY